MNVRNFVQRCRKYITVFKSKMHLRRCDILSFMSPNTDIVLYMFVSQILLIRKVYYYLSIVLKGDNFCDFVFVSLDNDNSVHQIRRSNRNILGIIGQISPLNNIL